jgi:ABC-type transporter Mla MlaB component
VPVRNAGPEPEHTPPVFTLGGTIIRAEIPGLCERLLALLTRDARQGAMLICDVGGLGRADVTAVEALARLQLTARQRGCRLWLRGASPELRALLALTGLAETLPVEPRGQIKQREQPRGVEEEGDTADPLPG